jgi:hypothetical protein
LHTLVDYMTPEVGRSCDITGRLGGVRSSTRARQRNSAKEGHLFCRTSFLAPLVIPSTGPINTDTCHATCGQKMNLNAARTHPVHAWKSHAASHTERNRCYRQTMNGRKVCICAESSRNVDIPRANKQGQRPGKAKTRARQSSVWHEQHRER